MGKRDTFAAGPTPYHERAPLVEAAKHLANAARRFVADRANVGDVDEAIHIWNRAAMADALTSEKCPRCKGTGRESGDDGRVLVCACEKGKG